MCGCPLVKNVFELTGDYCRVSKRKCNKHYNWEKLRRAEVDLERVRVVSQAVYSDTGRLSVDISEILILILSHVLIGKCHIWNKA